jgi:hypothetical protein
MPHDRASTRTSGRVRAAHPCTFALLAFLGFALAGCGTGGVSPTPTSSQAASATPSVSADAHLLSVLQGAWAGYKQGFISGDGRVSDPTRGGVTTSEGDALLRAVWMSDRSGFDAVWGWTRANLQVRGDGLFASLWGGGAVQDHNSASDADSDIALALLFAAHRFADSAYRGATALTPPHRTGAGRSDRAGRGRRHRGPGGLVAERPRPVLRSAAGPSPHRQRRAQGRRPTHAHPESGPVGIGGPQRHADGGCDTHRPGDADAKIHSDAGHVPVTDMSARRHHR